MSETTILLLMLNAMGLGLLLVYGSLLYFGSKAELENAIEEDKNRESYEFRKKYLTPK